MDRQPDVFALEPRSADILLVLARRGVLDARSAENDRSVAEGLHSILRSPRFAGTDPRHVYWSTQERLYNPRRQHPADRRASLRTFAQFDHLQHLGTDVLRIRVEPDVDTVARAVAEHAGRTFPDYDFGARDLKNTRLLVDVMVQSAFTNYAMAGRYDSQGDCDRRTGERGGVEYGSPGDTALRQDLGGLYGALVEIHPHTSLVHVDEWTAEESIRASQDAWTGGHHLDVPITITIDG